MAKTAATNLEHWKSENSRTGVPLLDAPLDYESRRDAARFVFRRLVFDPLFSGLPESVFHADPHAGNLMAQTRKTCPAHAGASSAVFASKTVVQSWSILFPWLDRPDFYRSGLPTRTLAAHSRARSEKNCLCRRKNFVDAFPKSVRCSVQKLLIAPKTLRAEHEEKTMNESEFYATEMTDAELDAQADAGEFLLDEQGFYLLPSPEEIQAMMEEGQQMLNDALWRQMNEEL